MTKRGISVTANTVPGGTFNLAEDLTVTRMGYGTMQLAGPGVFGPPKDRDEAIRVLREVIALGINHIDTSDYYGPFITNEIVKEALFPYPDSLCIVTKVGALRDAQGGPTRDLPSNSVKPCTTISRVSDSKRSTS